MKIHSPTPTYRLHRLLLTMAGAALFASVVPQASAAEMLAGVAANGRLVLFSSDDPGDVAVMQISGLQAEEQILGFDTRPATGQLYALGSSSRLYTLDWSTGTAIATAVGPGPFTPALSGTTFGFDFNPTVDRIRIVSNTGQNLRAHPVTGAIVAVDGSAAYATTDAGFGLSPMVAGCAYINNDTDPATGTVLYNLDVTRDVLVIQNPPNNGTLITVGALGVDVKDLAGFDVAGSDGTAYASLVISSDRNPNSDRAGLYTIDLMSGAATFHGKIGGPKPLTSLTALGSMP